MVDQIQKQHQNLLEFPTQKFFFKVHRKFLFIEIKQCDEINQQLKHIDKFR